MLIYILYYKEECLLFKTRKAFLILLFYFSLKVTSLEVTMTVTSLECMRSLPFFPFSVRETDTNNKCYLIIN